ncbi:permease [Burkholderia pseudomallei]|nr:permease [Burkholderia pseudomallei]
MKFPCRAGYVRRAARGRRRTIGMTRDEAVRGGVSRVACRVSRCALRDARCARIGVRGAA